MGFRAHSAFDGDGIRPVDHPSPMSALTPVNATATAAQVVAIAFAFLEFARLSGHLSCRYLPITEMHERYPIFPAAAMESICNLWNR
jgi:hypothetical protein